MKPFGQTPKKSKSRSYPDTKLLHIKQFVMEDGKAVGIGTHEQLLESCEEYQEIYWSQNERVLAKEEA